MKKINFVLGSIIFFLGATFIIVIIFSYDNQCLNNKQQNNLEEEIMEYIYEPNILNVCEDEMYDECQSYECFEGDYLNEDTNKCVRYHYNEKL